MVRHHKIKRFGEINESEEDGYSSSVDAKWEDHNKKVQRVLAMTDKYTREELILLNDGEIDDILIGINEKLTYLEELALKKKENDERFAAQMRNKEELTQASSGKYLPVLQDRAIKSNKELTDFEDKKRFMQKVIDLYHGNVAFAEKLGQLVASFQV